MKSLPISRKWIDASVSALALTALAASLGGCNSIASGINSITGALSSPQAAQAVANLKAGNQALLCALADVTAVAAVLDQQIKAGAALYKDSSDAYVVSGTICLALGGQVIGSVTVPPTASAVPK
jgi:hypothetical protein